HDVRSTEERVRDLLFYRADHRAHQDTSVLRWRARTQPWSTVVFVNEEERVVHSTFACQRPFVYLPFAEENPMPRQRSLITAIRDLVQQEVRSAIQSLLGSIPTG